MSLGRPGDYDPETDEPRNARVLRGLGGNYGAGMRPMRLEYDHGVFVPAEEEIARKRAPLTHIERQDLRYRLLIGLRRVLQNGGKVPADEMHPASMPNRARRSPDAMINRVPLNDLYVAQSELIDTGQVVRVEVARRCLLRPDDGPCYSDEKPWVDAGLVT
jgi:hypothetical protein